MPRRIPKPPRSLTEAWLRLGARRDRRSATNVLMEENRRRLIAELAPGRSFLDLGGMYAVAGDVSFWAEEAGATRVHLFDGMDPSDEFARKHAERGSRVTYQQADLHDPLDVQAAGHFDVTWCAGVIYHSPDPYRQLLHLRSMTTERLLLGSHVVPEPPGGIEGLCVFYPGRSPKEEQAFAVLHGDQAAAYPGATRPFIETPMLGYANMWWGFTPSALRALIHTAGFEILEEYRYTPVFMDIVARPAGTPDFIPQLGASRRRSRDLLSAIAAEERPQWWVVPDVS